MGIISKDNVGVTGWLRNSQMRYAMTYVLLTTLVLVFLNFYAAGTIQTMIFRSKETSLEDKTMLVTAALDEVGALNETSVQRAMEQLGSVGVARVVVTDANAVAVYDSEETDSAVGRIVLLPEIVGALEGNDVFYSTYADSALESRCAAPVLHYNNLVGAVYLMEYDTDQGRLIGTLQSNILTVTVVLEVGVTLFAIFHSILSSRRVRKIMASIRYIREGDYSHKVRLRGRDEMRALADEFNEMADRVQESERRKRQFVSDASHELKTPLASIKLLSDSILQNDMDTQTMREFVGDIGGEADRLTRLSQKLLSLSKVDSDFMGDMTLEDLGETASRVVKMLTPLAQHQDVTILNDTKPGHQVLVMEDDLYQIIFNLTENAIKYNKPGGTVRLSIFRLEDDLTLTVADTGVGIPRETQGSIFERFFRVDKARSRQAGGSGLGLSIVHDMVIRNNGTITVESELGQGSRFMLTLPAFDAEEVPL